MRMSIIAASALILSMAFLGFAQTETPAVYRDGSVRGLSKNAAGTLSTSDANVLTFSGEKTRWQAPYLQIKTIYVSLSRPSALGEVFGLGGFAVGAAKKRKLLVSLITTDDQGKSNRAVFFLPEGVADEFIALLEKRSQHKVVFESEEARLSLTPAKTQTNVAR